MKAFHRKVNQGFSLVEVIFAAGILSVIFLSSMFLIQFHRIQQQKAKEQAIMRDFCQHYMEIARQQPFFQVLPGQPINALFDGEHGAPEIRFPADDQWRTLWTEDFRNFHPDLEWLENRSPQYRCDIDHEIIAMESRSKHIELEVRWKPPLDKGSEWMSIQVDTMIYEGFN